jgi:hypothetical protein
MRGYNLKKIYSTLRAIGLIRSKRQFSRDWLNRGWSYLRDIETRHRDDLQVAPKTVAILRARVSAVARLTPPRLRSELEAVVASIDSAMQTVRMLGYGRLGR